MSLDDPAANAVAVSPSHPPTLAAEAELAPGFAPPSTTRRSGPLVPMILGAALFMQMLDSTIVANALPTMARSFYEDPVTLNMAITAYLLAAAMFLPISAWLADRFGARLVFR
ncbi:MAG: MFS transporter, partial [Sphingomonadaceae bacterium]|nr:MFS transporter [Sphingomonadaceae bacterium]